MKIIATSVSFLMAVCAAQAAGHGTWAIADTGSPGKVMLSLMRSGPDGRHSDSSSDWERADLAGLAWTPQEKHDVHFTIARDAGVIEGEGFLKAGEGAGTFRFTPQQQFAQEMSALGFDNLRDEDKLFAATVHNVSLNFARQMKAENIAGLDGDKLLAFRIFGVDASSLDELKKTLHTLPDADKLIAFRIHGVSPEFIRNLRAAGLQTDDPDKLIAFRIHGVSPDFVQAIERLGYPHPEPDKLIAMRIHGVTPEYIQGLHSRGVQNVTLDQLIALRISGVN